MSDELRQAVANAVEQLSRLSPGHEAIAQARALQAEVGATNAAYRELLTVLEEAIAAFGSKLQGRIRQR